MIVGLRERDAPATAGGTSAPQESSAVAQGRRVVMGAPDVRIKAAGWRIPLHHGRTGLIR